MRKIHTLGVRSAYVGEFEVKDHELPQTDVIAEGRDAWDAVFGTVTLGKFFLGFGSIGICEHALAEAAGHLRQRILYGKPVLEMPHIRFVAAQAYARLTAMKLFAFRALDYVQAASAQERRYLLFTAVQKARLSTEGVKVITLLSECIGAKGFEADTYFEMALRDIQLIPGLEGSTHINLTLASQFIPRYFDRSAADLGAPASLLGQGTASPENSYLFEARSGHINTIAFPHFLNSYKPLARMHNVRVFARQAKALALLARRLRTQPSGDTPIGLSMGQCLANIAYAQLVAENAVLLNVPPQMTAAIFHLLSLDLCTSSLTLASLPGMEIPAPLLRRLLTVPATSSADWDFVAERVASSAMGAGGAG